MRVGVMVTEGGPHSPDTWAEATADQIIDISADAPDTKLAEARMFREKLVEILSGHHQLVQEQERGQIDEQGHARLIHDLDVSECVDAPAAEIVETARGLSFESHFAKPETQAYLRQVLGSHFATSMHIERSWHADRHPDTDEARAFRAKYHSGV